MADAAEAGKPQSQAEFILYTTLRIIGVLASIYMFLMGLDMMGSSFLVLGGKGAGDLFTIVGNPVTGLMVGIIATAGSVLLHEHLDRGLVGAGQVSVKYAIAYSSAAVPDFAPASGVPILPLRPGTCLRNALACKPSGMQ